MNVASDGSVKNKGTARLHALPVASSGQYPVLSRLQFVESCEIQLWDTNRIQRGVRQKETVQGYSEWSVLCRRVTVTCEHEIYTIVMCSYKNVKH